MSNLKVGVFGAGRGMFLATDFMLNGCDVVAVCDNHPDRLDAAVKKFGKDITDLVAGITKINNLNVFTDSEMQINYYKKAITTLMNKKVSHSYLYFLSKNIITEV